MDGSEPGVTPTCGGVAVPTDLRRGRNALLSLKGRWMNERGEVMVGLAVKSRRDRNRYVRSISLGVMDNTNRHVIE